MKKKDYGLLIVIILLLLSFVGCTKDIEVENEIEPNQKDTSLVETTEQTEQTEGTVTIENKINEFALYVDGVFYPLDEDYVFDTILEGEDFEEFEAEFPYPSSRKYYGDSLEISTFLVDDERGKGEVIYNIIATKSAKTVRGVEIGDTLTELQSAYSNLKYEGEWLPEENNPKFNRVYVFTLEGDSKYITFFLYEREIVMISVQEGFDIIPGKDIDEGNILGIKNVIREINDMSSKGAIYRYYYTNESGEEELLLEIDGELIDEVDIDDDGITELLVYLKSNNNKKSIGIFDMIDDEISYIDVNKTTGGLWSSGMENISNLKREYSKCIEIGFEDENGNNWTEIYSVIDNELIYVTDNSSELLY